MAVYEAFYWAETNVLTLKNKPWLGLGRPWGPVREGKGRNMRTILNSLNNEKKK